MAVRPLKPERISARTWERENPASRVSQRSNSRRVGTAPGAACLTALMRASVGRYRRDGGRPGPFNLPSPHARVRHERLDARLPALHRGTNVLA
ncbi:MAG TPA: hypothetical protein PK405_02495, partial [Hyphomicrobiales bacterium]|nr:hypothetical protein [Hyphomicrobiales bacterium]